MTMPAIDIELRAASFFATHFASPDDALAGREREATAPKFPLLVARARRFTSLATQLHIEVCGVLSAPRDCPSVFATCHGEIQTAFRLMGEFRDGTQVSSAHFAQSVHNTPSGLYSVATGDTAPSTTITGANALAAGWLEAALIARETDGPVLLSIADEPVPPPFLGPPETSGVAAAFLLATGTGARLSFEEDSGTPERMLLTLARLVALVESKGTGSILLGPVLAGGALRLQV